MPLKAVAAVIQSGSVSIVDADDSTKRLGISDDELPRGTAALAARLVSGGRGCEPDARAFIQNSFRVERTEWESPAAGVPSKHGLRMDHQRRLFVTGGPLTFHNYVDEGTGLVACNPAIGTGLTWVAAQVAFLDTGPNFYIYNNEDPSPQALTIWLHYLKLICTAVGTAASAWHYAFVLQKGRRDITTDNLLYVPPSSPGGTKKSSIAWAGATKQDGSVFAVQNAAAASVIAASTKDAHNVARGVLGGLNIIGDAMQINFGTFDAGVVAATTAAEGANQPGKRGDCSTGLGCPPGYTLTGHIWAPSSSASINPEFEAGLVVK